MRIKQLNLKNGYKRFHDLTIDLGDNPKRIIALIGPNGCGKSSVLDGMLFHQNAYHTIGIHRSKGPQYHSLHGSDDFDYKNIEITFTDGNYQDIRTAKAQTGTVGTMFVIRSPYRYNSNLNVKEAIAVDAIKNNSYGAQYASDLDDKMEQNYRRLNIAFNQYMMENDVKPSQAKAKIIGDLNASLTTCLDLQIDNIGNIESGQGTIYFRKKDQDKPFEFNVLSSGEKEVVDILLDLYLRKDDYHDSIFLIDEPELHINTSIQRKLLIEINKLIGQNCQIWITTHSIGFIRALQDDLKNECQIVQFGKDIKWASEPQVLYPMKNTRANWSRIFETAIDDLTGLVSPKQLVYCEGIGKPGLSGTEKGMDAQVFNNIFNDKYHDTLFISSGGNTELDQRSEIAIAILTKVFSDIEILVFKDRDSSSGKKTSLEDRDIYLQNNPDNHRMMKRWEIENYLFDKEVLTCYCSENNKVFNETDYDKQITDIKNQDVKSLVNHIRNFCGINTSINADKFKITLSSYLRSEMDVYKELEDCIFKKYNN
ncbi:AAA family ATPase [Pedobacter cryoconitis]|uniref:AAA family ATPase n=1 Tax=Pedobacter cryoconitis TaxID=188932 RepID=UPI0016090DB3|nr:ATP-binding protein [Pedobacter cryoconitis]MBB5645158.1 putative ATPase [Pedobacter cryoconitis]